MQPIVNSLPASGGWIAALRLQAGEPVQYQERPAPPPTKRAAALRQTPPEGPVAIGSLFAEVLARYGVEPATAESPAPATRERVDMVA
jgi:hypothetical protein